jgi:hypothetical protein
VNTACLRAMISLFERGPAVAFDAEVGEDGVPVSNTRVFLRYANLMNRMLDFNRNEVC